MSHSMLSFGKEWTVEVELFHKVIIQEAIWDGIGEAGIKHVPNKTKLEFILASFYVLLLQYTLLSKSFKDLK